MWKCMMCMWFDLLVIDCRLQVYLIIVQYHKVRFSLYITQFRQLSRQLNHSGTIVVKIKESVFSTPSGVTKRFYVCHPKIELNKNQVKYPEPLLVPLFGTADRVRVQYGGQGVDSGPTSWVWKNPLFTGARSDRGPSMTPHWPPGGPCVVSRQTGESFPIVQK